MPPHWKDQTVEKVTAFVTRPGTGGVELLVFDHPSAGMQVPAGTVETGELPEAAALREVREETGLERVEVVRGLGEVSITLPPGRAILRCRVDLLKGPAEQTGRMGFQLGHGWTVEVQEERGGFGRVLYHDWDWNNDPPAEDWSVMGWVPLDALAATVRRHFYLLRLVGAAPQAWDQPADQGYTFHCHWAPLSPPPPLISPQDGWLSILKGNA